MNFLVFSCDGGQVQREVLHDRWILFECFVSIRLGQFRSWIHFLMGHILGPYWICWFSKRKNMISTRFQHIKKTLRWGEDVLFLNREEMLQIFWSSYNLRNLWSYLRIFGHTSKHLGYVRFIYKELGRMGNTQISHKVCVYELRGMFS